MSRVRSRDTVPELLLRRELHRRGLRYRLGYQLPGKPDVTFVSARVAVFVDGDMWHGHGWRERGFSSMEEQFANHRDPAFWVAKIRRNVERDAEVGAELSSLGWRVVRVLESQVRRDPGAAADVVEAAVRGPAGGPAG
ncbi:very short patch repair endonuclease [Kribbella sp. NPDC051137]|uniref:very short patch repair endonuclease n=1 Tax=Kribbella sp. NPDC051137 TaxID=3155045 RepID=UPI003428F46C